MARPIQMKAASRRHFSIFGKYAQFPNLWLAFAWHLADPDKAVTYALTYEKTPQIAEAIGWTTTASWQEGQGYSTQNPGAKLIDCSSHTG